MSEKLLLAVAGIIFLMISAAHILRLLTGADVIIAGYSIPMWASAAAAVFMGFLAYEAFHWRRLAGR